MMSGTWHHSFLTDFPDVQGLNECGEAQQDIPSGHGHNGGAQGPEDRLSARRTHKADREKLRRDKLNEQFSELANALDPDRPKNDKATILGESIQVVKELREEVKRLKTEHASLLDESADLTLEKNELRDEIATLKNETERSQNQLQQRLRSSSPWMTMDPTLLMGAAAAPSYHPYPIPIPQPVSLGGDNTDSHRPLVNPTSYLPMAPPIGPFPIHPYAVMGGNRPGEGGNNASYVPFPGFPPPPVTSHSHIERPYAQYPTPVQPPMPGYVVQLSPSVASQTTAASAVYRPFVPAIPVLPVNQDSRQKSDDRNDDPSNSQSSSCQQISAKRQEHAVIQPGQVSDINSNGDTASVATSQERDLNNAELHAGKDPSSSSINFPSNNSLTLPVKKNLETSLDRPCLSVEGHSNDLLDVNSQTQSENVHDPTLRPPAA